MRRKNKEVGFNIDSKGGGKKKVNKNKYQNTLFSREALLNQTNDNMRRAEARTNERPLRTEHSYRLDNDQEDIDNEDEM